MKPAVKACLVALVVPIVACGDDVRGTASDSAATTTTTTTSSPPTSTDPTMGSSGGSGSATESGSGTSGPGTSAGTTSGGLKFDMGIAPDFGGNPGCGDSGGEPDTMFSYIWIANSAEGTVSKIDSLIAANSGVYARIQRVG